MKAVLEFNLPEERNEHMLALRGADYASAIYALDEKFRAFLKYGQGNTEAQDAEAQRWRDELHAIMAERNITTEDL